MALSNDSRLIENLKYYRETRLCPFYFGGAYACGYSPDFVEIGGNLVYPIYDNAGLSAKSIVYLYCATSQERFEKRVKGVALEFSSDFSGHYEYLTRILDLALYELQNNIDTSPVNFNGGDLGRAHARRSY